MQSADLGRAPGSSVSVELKLVDWELDGNIVVCGLLAFKSKVERHSEIDAGSGMHSRRMHAE